MLRLLLILLLSCFFLKETLGQSNCSFQSSKYKILWSLDNNNNVNYNLTYFNFPTDDNYWVAFGYSQPINNLILVDSVNGQIEIATANMVYNQPKKTVNSNILQQKSAFLSGGSLHAQFSIPLDALRLTSDNGDGCLQWQFYTNATKNGTDYNGTPQIQSVCNIQSCRQPDQLLLNDQGVTKNPYQYYNDLTQLYQRQLQTQGSNAPYNNYQYQQANGINNNNQYQQQQMQNNGGQNGQYSNQYGQYQPYQAGSQNGYPNSQQYNGGQTTQSPYSPQYDQSQQQYQSGSSQNGFSSTQASPCSNCNQQTSQNNVQYSQGQQQQQTGGCQSCNQQQQASPCQNCNQQQTSSCQSCNQQGGSQFGNSPQYDSSQYQNTQYGIAGSPYQNQGVYQNAFSANQIPGGRDGAVYDSPLTNSNSDYVVENPNYIFLNPGLTQEFRDSVNRPNNQNGLFRDQNGNAFPSTTTLAPVLSNEQQNQLNYQRIQSNPPTTVAPSLYTNNLYGYDYRSNQNQPYTVNGNNQQYQPPAYRKFEAPQGSPFRKRRQVRQLRKRRQATQSLSGTAYAGQDQKFIRTDNNFNQFNNQQFNDPTNNQQQQSSSQNTFSTSTFSPNFNTNTNNNFNSNSNNNFNTNSGFVTNADPHFFKNNHYLSDQPQYYPVNNNNFNNNNNNFNTNTNPSSYSNTNNNNNFNNNNPQQQQQQQYNYQTVQRDQQQNNAAIYWPYRQQVVSADDVVNPNSPNYTQVLQQNDAAEQAFENPNCSGQDPYWCQDYVQNFMLQYRLDGLQQVPSQQTCGALTESLRTSNSRCCHTVRGMGCNA